HHIVDGRASIVVIGRIGYIAYAAGRACLGGSGEKQDLQHNAAVEVVDVDDILCGIAGNDRANAQGATQDEFVKTAAGNRDLRLDKGPLVENLNDAPARWVALHGVDGQLDVGEIAGHAVGMDSDEVGNDDSSAVAIGSFDVGSVIGRRAGTIEVRTGR